MQDNSFPIGKLTREHKQALERLQHCEMAIRKITMLQDELTPSDPETFEKQLVALNNTLSRIGTDFKKHASFEEKEILPVLTKYASQIINQGLVLEHKHINEKIADLKKKVSVSLQQKYALNEMVTKQMELRTTIGALSALVEMHCETQSALYRLASEVLQEI